MASGARDQLIACMQVRGETSKVASAREAVCESEDHFGADFSDLRKDKDDDGGLVEARGEYAGVGC